MRHDDDKDACPFQFCLNASVMSQSPMGIEWFMEFFVYTLSLSKFSAIHLFHHRTKHIFHFQCYLFIYFPPEICCVVHIRSTRRIYRFDMFFCRCRSSVRVEHDGFVFLLVLTFFCSLLFNSLSSFIYYTRAREVFTFCFLFLFFYW